MKAQPQARSKPSRPFHGRLANRMLLILLPVLLLPVLLMGSIAYFRSYTILRGQITQQLTSNVEAKTRQIEERIETKRKFLTQLAAQNTFTTPLNEFLTSTPENSKYLFLRADLLLTFQSKTLAESKPSFDQLLIADLNGKILAATNKEWEGMNLSGSQMESLLGTEKTLAVYNSIPLYINRFLVLCSVPYTVPGDHKVTIIGVSESNDPIQDLESSMLIHPDALAYYFTKDGFFLGLNPDKSGFIPLEPEAKQKAGLLPLITGGDKSGFGEYLSFNSHPVYAYAKWIPELEAGIVVELPRELIAGPLFKLAFSIFGLVGLTVIVLGAIIWLGTRSLTKPIVLLSKTTQSFAEGEWQQRAIVDRNDEIGLLAHSFNQMADELTNLYRSLESKVEARTQQIRMAAEVAAIATSAPNLQELLHRTVSLIVERFGYYDASIFIVDETRSYALLAESSHETTDLNQPREFRLPVGGQSFIGWVTANNQPRVSSDVMEDSLYLKDELLPETRSEAVVPIAVGNYVLGAMDIQSKEPDAFGQEDLTVLQTLSNQIATAIQNARLLEVTQVNLEEASLLYHSSRQIAGAATEDDIVQVVAKALRQTSYLSATFLVDNNGLWPVAITYPTDIEKPMSYERLPVSREEIESLFPGNNPYLLADLHSAPEIPESLAAVLQPWQWSSIAFVPVKRGGLLAFLFILATQENNSFTPASIQPFANLAELAATALDKVQAQKNMEQRLNELQTLNTVSQEIAQRALSYDIYQIIHDAIRRSMGHIYFLIATYDSETNLIQLPYVFSGSKVSVGDPYPLGSDLVSNLIRTRQPLLLSSVDEEHRQQLEARTFGIPPKSWLGVPLIVGGDVIGALVLQDVQQEGHFTQDDLQFISTLSGQVAASIRNALVYEATQQKAEREQLLYELTKKIRGSVNIQNILEITATELGKALGARRALIEVGVVEETPVISLPVEKGNGGPQ